MQRAYRFICLLIVGGLLSFASGPVFADAAPPAAADGSNISSGEQATMVQMVAEEVLVDVGYTKREIIDLLTEAPITDPQPKLVSPTPTATEAPTQAPDPTPTPQPEEQSRVDYYIALGVLGALTLLSSILGRVAKRKRRL